MASNFRIRIQDIINAREALIVPGGRGERDMVEAIVKAVMSRSVGVLKSERSVERAVREGVVEVLNELKYEVKPG